MVLFIFFSIHVLAICPHEICLCQMSTVVARVVRQTAKVSAAYTKLAEFHPMIMSLTSAQPCSQVSKGYGLPSTLPPPLLVGRYADYGWDLFAFADQNL